MVETALITGSAALAGAFGAILYERQLQKKSLRQAFQVEIDNFPEEAIKERFDLFLSEKGLGYRLPEDPGENPIIQRRQHAAHQKIENWHSQTLYKSNLQNIGLLYKYEIKPVITFYKSAKLFYRYYQDMCNNFPNDRLGEYIVGDSEALTIDSQFITCLEKRDESIQLLNQSIFRQRFNIYRSQISNLTNSK